MNAMRENAFAAQKATPHWAGYITPTSIDLVGAKEILIDNPMMADLPRLVRDLQSSLTLFSQCGVELELPPANEAKETKEIVGQATNAMEFGQHTVRVARAMWLGLDLHGKETISEEVPKEAKNKLEKNTKLLESLRLALEAIKAK